jgi:hypothetical protein
MGPWLERESPQLRAGDADREIVAARLRDEHLAGRLDADELDRRVGRCLAARTYAELNALTADLPADRRTRRPTRRPGRPRAQALGAPATTGPRRLRGALRKLAAAVAIYVLVIWALTTSGAPFWPAWVWFGLALPFCLASAIRRAWRRPAGCARRMALVATFCVAVQSTLVVVWALVWLVGGGATYFWPVWPAMALIAIAAMSWLAYR